MFGGAYIRDFTVLSIDLPVLLVLKKNYFHKINFAEWARTSKILTFPRLLILKNPPQAGLPNCLNPLISRPASYCWVKNDQPLISYHFCKPRQTFDPEQNILV